MDVHLLLFVVSLVVGALSSAVGLFVQHRERQRDRDAGGSPRGRVPPPIAIARGFGRQPSGTTSR